MSRSPAVPEPAPPAREVVRAYYEHNTGRFLARGAQQRTGTIHRAVWAPGVRSAEQALQYLNERLLADLEALRTARRWPYLRTLDLGCGVGASLFYAAARFSHPFWGLGLTISPSQARLARQTAQELDLARRTAFVEGDFLHPPLGQACEAAWAFESFAHTDNPGAFFAAAAAMLKPGGWLILCDDTLSPSGEAAGAARLLELFRWGWNVPAVLPFARLLALADQAGLRLHSERDLTPHLRPRGLPAWLVRLWAAVLQRQRRPDPYWRAVLGGQAQAACYRRGWLAYRYLVFEKGG